MLAFVIKVTHGVPSSALGICKGRGATCHVPGKPHQAGCAHTRDEQGMAYYASH